MGRQVPRRVVPPNHAIPHRTHEEDRSFVTQSSRTHPKLFPCSKAAFQRRRGGLEQQGESHYEKIVRFSHLSRPRTRPLPLTWQAARTRFHPRFLLTNLLACTGEQMTCTASTGHFDLYSRISFILPRCD